MKFAIGQRYMSEMEPELGLGVLVDVQSKRITVRFGDGERIYGKEAPVKRIIFRVGDTINLLSGLTAQVEQVREEEGLYFYTAEGQEVSEMFLSDKITFTTPLERLYRGMGDRNREYEARITARTLQQQIAESPARGYVGGKIELFPHQFSVAEAIAKAETRRFFLADEVGLGKTIEASLALHRLMITGEVHRVLIVVPAALLHQWFIELYRRFALLATVVNSDLRNRFKSDQTLFEYESPVIVSSEDLASGDELSIAMLAAEWEMLIVDEAHHLETETPEYEIISDVSQRVRDILLLTASPDAMERHSFFSLLQLIDRDKYATFEQFEKEQADYERVAKIAESVLSGTQLSNESESYLKKRVPALSQQLSDGLVSSSKREDFVRSLVDICGTGRAIFRNSRALIAGFPKREVQLVALDGDYHDIIPAVVSQWIHEFLLEQSGKKVLIICKNMEALRLLECVLGKVKSRRIALFHEDMSIVLLDRNAAWFADPEGAELLIATEIGAEGRNFQYADFLILPDLPEEPEQLEQRIGRLDRIGRKGVVSVIIPYVKKSETALMADWYHRGLNAFEHTVAGAHTLGELFMGRVIGFEGSLDEWESLIDETKKARIKIAERVEKGRSRLLELASCNFTRADRLIAAVSSVESLEIRNAVEVIFAHFGISMEEHGNELIYVDFDLLTEHTFPIPPMREEGMSITFDRDCALAREDVEFVSIDHPMVLGGLELLLGGEKGNCSCARLPQAGEEGLLFELVYRIFPKGGTTLFPEAYLPGETVRLLYDDAGDEVSDIFSFFFLKENLKEAGFDSGTFSLESLKELLEPILASSQDLIEEKRAQLIQQATDTLVKEVTSEISRLRDLTCDIEAMEQLQERAARIKNLLEETSLTLDAVRVIVLEK